MLRTDTAVFFHRAQVNKTVKGLGLDHKAVLGGQDRAARSCLSYKHKLDMLERALEFIYLCEQRRRFFKWLDWGEEYGRQMRLVQSALNKLIKRALFAAFTKWRETSGEDSKAERLMLGVLNRLRHQKLSMAWEQWQAW